MMAQNRQDQRDRIQNDYIAKMILRNEHQTRHINAKVDHLLNFQWKRLLEIQEIQTTLLQIQQKRHKLSNMPEFKRSLSIQRGFSILNPQYLNMEIDPDPFVRVLLRHYFDLDIPDDHFIFSQWHEDGDNYTGTVDSVVLKFENQKIKSITFDLVFHHHRATMDDLFTGEGFINFRNDFNLPHMAPSGQISHVELFSQGQSTIVYNGQFPARYKPAFALTRQDRITDFWKSSHEKIRISYHPLHQFRVYHLPNGQALRNISATFLPDPSVPSAIMYLREFDPNSSTNGQEMESIGETAAQALVQPDSSMIDWKTIAQVSWDLQKKEFNSISVPLPDIVGPKTFAFFCKQVRLTIHGHLDEVAETGFVDESLLSHS